MKLEPDDIEGLRPLIETIVAETVARLSEQPAGDGPRAFKEREAAERIGVPFHVLRDARRRGEIVGVKVGRSWCYTESELNRYLNRNVNPTAVGAPVVGENNDGHQ